MKKPGKQHVICLTAAFGGLLFGFDAAVMAGALQSLRVQFGLTASMETWLISIGLLGCLAGVLLAGCTIDKWGRKKTITLSGWLFLLSALTCAGSYSVSMLMAGRFIGGLGVGVASVVVPIIISEFSPAPTRGRMISCYYLAISSGILLAFLSNALLEKTTAQRVFQTEAWRPMFLVIIIPAILFLILLSRIPESPRWLIFRNERQKAASILYSLVAPTYAASEFKAMEDAFDKQESMSRSVWAPAIKLPLATGIALAIMQQLCGLNVLLYYSPGLLQQTGLLPGNTFFFQLILGSVNLAATLLAIRWADKFGRKNLLKFGLMGIIISLACCGSLVGAGYSESEWFMAAVFFFSACFACSLGPVTWIIISEIFPTHVRVKAVVICTFLLWATLGLLQLMVPWLLASLGLAGLFGLFIVSSFLNLLFCWKMMRETNGRSLEEMENVFVTIHKTT